MAIRDKATVDRYVRMHAEILAALENLQEFVETMPAPVDGCIPNVDYTFTGDVGRIHEAISEAARISDGLGR